LFTKSVTLLFVTFKVHLINKASQLSNIQVGGYIHRKFNLHLVTTINVTERMLMDKKDKS